MTEYHPITFKRAPTAQQLFDAVAAHLLRQGRKSLNGRGCAYRGPEGTMCAVGCVLPNESYHKGMEGQNVAGLFDYHARLLPKWFTEHARLLRALQYAHDHKTAPEWPSRLVEVAATFELSARVVAEESKK